MCSLLVAVALFSFAVGCGSNVPGPPYIRTTASSDMQTFEKYVNLPEKPKAVTFETTYRTKPGGAPGPTDWSLIAILTYEPGALGRIKDKAPRQKDPVLLDPGKVRPWFPQVVKDALVSSGSKGFIFPVLLARPKHF